MDAPTGMASSYPQSWNRCLSDEWSAFLTEAHMAWEVASLLSLDWGGAEYGADSPNVGRQVIALGLITLDEVGSLGKRDGGVGFTCIQQSVKERREKARKWEKEPYRTHILHGPGERRFRGQRSHDVSFFVPCERGALERNPLVTECR